MAERREPRFGRDPDDTRDERLARGEERRASVERRRERSRERRDDRRESRRENRRARRRRRSLLGRAFGGIVRTGILVVLWGGVAGAGLVAYEATKLPPIDQIAIPLRPPNIAVLAADGSLIANRGDTGGAAVKLAELPAYLPDAFIAIEDRRFLHHFGVDPVGIGRAVVSDLMHRGMQGGSTLTQQLAKNLFLTQERTLHRKIQEAILAVWLEHRFTKQQILELYLNRMYFGSGAFGVEAAAHKYFNTDARHVGVAQAAMLAGLMKAPTKLAPNRNYAGAVARAAQVVAAMREEGYITPAQAKDALANPARVVRAGGVGSLNYAADYVVDTLDDLVGAPDEDIVVRTTIDRRLQAAAEAALTGALDSKGRKFGVGEGAMVALDPAGAIRVLIGGRDYAVSQFDRAVSAHRQPGSAFKPFVYLAGLEHGLTPDSVIPDAPINVRGWRPENYSHDYAGPVTLTHALAQSLNTVAVRVCLEAGPRSVVDTAHRLGIASELQPNASIALGTSEVTPLEITAAYAPFMNGGIGVQPHVVTTIKTAGGRLLYQRRDAGNGRVVEPRLVAEMNAMMAEVLSSGTARKGGVPGWQAAGKTGTSQDFRDAWFIGYTARLVAGVWLGNDDASPTKHASGGSLPVEVWSRFMVAAMAGQAPAPLPLGLARAAPPEASAPPTGIAGAILGALTPSAAAPQRPQPPISRDLRQGDTRQGDMRQGDMRRGEPDDAPQQPRRASERQAAAPRRGDDGSIMRKLFGDPL